MEQVEMSDQVSVETVVLASGAADAAEMSRASWLDRPSAALPALAAWNWELVAWVALVAGGFLLRLYNVGARGMSHDESLHTLYAYYLFNEGRYEHNPMMHGPFRYHLTALAYFLFGDSDTVARLWPVIMGTALTSLMFLLRRWIGRTGALVAALLVTVSPSILFHSRYIRDDIFIATFTTVWAIGAFRYLETRRFGWLAFMVGGMAFGFVTMENSFLTGAVFGAFFVLLALWHALDWRTFLVIAPLLPAGVISYYYHANDRDDIAIPALLIGAGIAAVLVVVFFFTNKGAWRRLRSSVAADLAVLMATLVLPFMAPFAHVLLGGSADVFKESEYLSDALIARMALLVVVMAAAAAALAFAWFFRRKPDPEQPDSTEQAPGLITLGTWWPLMAGFWIVQVIFFTTVFTNVRNGLATGIVGSLGYWLAQQQVERGSQPWYYYLFIGGIYEYLPILLTLGGAVALARGLLVLREWEPVAARDLPAQPDALTPETASAVRTWFVVFALFWVAGMWAAYTVAGEKMPWLMTHMALPMCVFGGWWIGKVLTWVEWRRAWTTGGIWLIAVVPALILVGAILCRADPSFDRTTASTAGIMRAVLAALALIGLLYLVWRWGRAAGWRQGAGLLGLGVLSVLFVLNTRASFVLNYVNYDMATEYLVYAHASPDVKRALAEIDAISQRTVGDRNIVVAYDDDSAWPFSWYMRQYPNARFYGDNPTGDAMSAPVVIAGPKNRDKVQPYLERDYAKRTYRLIWWPDMDYFNLSRERLWNAITDPQQRERLWQIWMYRRHRNTDDFSKFRDLTQWPARHEFDMWVRRDLAAQIWDLEVTPAGYVAPEQAALAVPDVDVSATSLIQGDFGGLPLTQPRAVAVGPQGERAVADTGNHRIVVTDAAGNFLTAFGSRCDLAQGAAGGCVDPDGSGPLALGDGQFNEPWGIAVAPDGTIFVADTWNGRIQRFAPDGTFQGKWGVFNTTNGELGDPYALFGPRGLAMTLDGNLVVADTGNKRILIYTPAGELVNQVGGGGVVAGRFDEPTGVAVDPGDGSILVADAWNRRIQRFDPALNFVAEWPVPSWESKDLYHKPQIAVAAGGDVYATDPQFFRVFVFDRSGAPKASFGRFGQEMNRFGLPVGIAADSASNAVLVADSDNHRIMVMPFVN